MNKKHVLFDNAGKVSFTLILNDQELASLTMAITR